MSIVGTGLNLAVQGMDFSQAYDDATQKLSPLFKQHNMGGMNPDASKLRRLQWRHQVDQPDPVKGLLQQKLSSECIKETVMSTLSREKLAAIVYKNGHAFSTDKTAAGGESITKLVDFIAKAPLKAMGIGLGAGVLGRQIYSPIADNYKSQAAYPEMFNKFPELKNADQTKVDDYWNIMREYSPSMTHNPIVAGQFIKNMMDFGMEGIDHPTLKSLIDIQGAQEKTLSNGPMSVADVARMV